MNKYSAVSNIELNHAVAVACGYKIISCEESVLAYVDSGYKPFDPCNNPADAMPIVIENNIDLLNGDNVSPDLFGHHSAYTLFNFIQPIASDSLKESKTIYRLAMEVFLMMKDAENVTCN